MDLSYITANYFPKLSPAEINGGNCYNWAYRAFKLYPEAKLYSSNMWGGHAWVKIDKQYYDAEHPKGTIKLSDIIPAITNYPEDNGWVQGHIQHQTERAFRRFWRITGPRRKRA
jgi:hypothetical protein